MTMILRVVLKIGSVLAIVPWYSYSKRRLIYKKLCTTYALTLVIIYSVAVAFAVYSRQGDFLLKNPLAVALEWISDTTLVFLTLLIVFRTATLKRQTMWQKLAKSVAELEEKCKMIPTTKSKKIPLHIAELILTHALFIIYYIYEIYISVDSIGFHYFSQFGIIILFQYYVFVIILCITNFAWSIRNKYRDINVGMSKIDEKKLAFTEKSILKELDLFKKYYRRLGEIIGFFNELFGFELLLITFYSVLQILNCANFGLTLITSNSALSLDIFISNMYLGLFLVGGLLYLIMACDSATTEGQKITRICIKLQDKFPQFSKTQDELITFMDTVEHFEPKFTSLGFFEINRRTMFSLISTATTYLIVVIQFHGTFAH